MSTSGKTQAPTSTAKAIRAWVSDRKVWVELDDGREIGFPVDRYRRLKDADRDQLSQVRIEACGAALRWDEIDEDLSIAGILAGRWLP